MSCKVFNREEFQHPEDGWYQIEPKGTHPNREAGVDQVIDDTACAAIVNCFNADADAGKLSHGREMLIDHEHFKNDPDQETVAYGWLTRLQKRADGIYGKIRWTTLGQSAVDGGEYRFFSSEYDPGDLTVLSGGEVKRVRPERLDGLTLTNQPNNRGGKPITNRTTVRESGPAPSNPSVAIQNRAAQRIGQFAEEEQRASGGSFASCYLRVMNREKSLCDLASGRPVSTGAKAGAREVLEDAAGFAGRSILRLAQNRKLPGLSANIRYIRNRFPRLARMENRQAGWDVLGELEPVARRAYMDAVQQKDSMPEPRFVAMLMFGDDLALEFPQLGDEGRWQKLKELFPATFLKFVLSFDDLEGCSIMGPAPKTEQESWQRKRSLIGQAAENEFRAYGKNPPYGRDLTVQEALSAL